MLTKLVSRCVLSTLAIIAGFTPPLVAQAALSKSQNPSRIVSQIDDSARFTIVGSRPRPATLENDIGPLEGAQKMSRMILMLGASPDQEYQARTLLDSQQTKGSPDYHHWLTPDEFGQKFGPSAQDIQQVTGWLQQRGFSVDSLAKSGRWIEFSGTVAQVEAAFQTQMRQYRVAGETHVANATDISIPAALSPVVKGVFSLHNLFSKPAIVRSPLKATAVAAPGKPDITFTDGSHAIVPGDFAKIYHLNPLYTANLNGTGQTIAIVAASNIALSDVANFRSLFGLPANPPNIILNGPDPGIDFFFGIGAEATLDTEWSGGVAPNATIDVVVSGGSLTTDPVALSSSFIVDQNLASVMNVSFGICEGLLGSSATDGNPFWTTLWEQAAAQGISVFVSTGDTGAAGCDPNAPSNTAAQGGVGINGIASTPFNTAVGGTEFNETVNGGLVATFWGPANDPVTRSSAIGYIPEKVWNESCTPSQSGSVCAQIGQFLLFSGGGGVSQLYPTPPWQTLNVTGLSALNSFFLPSSSLHPRGIPDISLTAAVLNDPYVFCFSVPGTPDCQSSGGSTTFNNLAGGTSFSSPAFAGIMAIVDQKLSAKQGLANYVLYPLAANETFSSCNSSSRTDPAVPSACVFNDTTVSNNGVPGNDITNDPTTGALGFPTATGYDLASGLGSVDANNLVNAWATLAAGFQGTVTSITTSMGASVNITHGQTVTLTAQVQKSPTGAGPTGTVSFITNESAPLGGTFAVGGGVLSSGSFSAPFNNLPGGSYNLSAHYPGDGTFASSDSAGIPVTVAAENTTTTLKSFLVNLNTGSVTAGATSVAYGDSANILVVDADTAGVSGLLPATGNVSFKDGGNALVQIAVDNSGISEFADCFSVSCLVPGSHIISASYAGDGLSYNGSSTAASLTITVTKGNPAAVINGPSTAGSGIQFSLQVTIQAGLGTITPTGTVQFMDGATALGSPVTLSGGQGTLATTLTTGGAHNITVQYSGDTTYNPAVSSALIINVVTPFNFTSPTRTQTIAAGGTATFNVSLNGAGGFTGAVKLACTGAPAPATCAITPNPANLSSTVTSVPLTVTVSNTTNARLTPAPFRNLPFVFAGMIGAALLGMRRKSRQRLLVLCAVVATIALSSCGGGSTPRGPTNATLTVTATSGATTSTITLNLTITH